MAETAPINESQRIESLDVLRGFALLGILLLNIIGFGFIAKKDELRLVALNAY